jgi:DNA-binding PadR family transcriptional regulator
VSAGEPIGQIEFAVLAAVHGGAPRSRLSARQIRALREQPAGDTILHDALRRCERHWLLRSRRNASGRQYELTASGRARFRADRRVRLALARVLAQSYRVHA